MYFDLTFFPIDKFVKKKKERKTSLNLLWNSDLLDFLSCEQNILTNLRCFVVVSLEAT